MLTKHTQIILRETNCSLPPQGKITAQGKLLLHGPLYCVEGASSSDKNSYNAQKPKELHVFLFEQNIIFAEIVGKKTQFTSPSYIYKAHIQVRFFVSISRCTIGLSDFERLPLGLLLLRVPI